MLRTTKLISSGRNKVHPARSIVVVNGQRVKHESFLVEQNGFSAADSFELTLPFFITDNSGDKILANGPGFTSSLFTLSSVPLQIYVGYPSNIINYGISDLAKVMDGFMDTVDLDCDETGERLTLHGRNVVGKMIDAKIYDKYPNMTASSIATMFAQKYGLTPKITPTYTFAGNYYNDDCNTLGNETNEWDLLLFLAKQENFIARIKGNQLMFGPYATVTGYANQSPLQYTWGSDIASLHIERSLHAAKDIIVKVISYDRDSKGRIIETAKSTTERAIQVKGQLGEREQYVETYIIPGLTRDQAQKKAQSILVELSQSELIGNMSCAGNTAMEIDRKLQPTGLGDLLGQVYYLNKVDHRFDLANGYQNDISFSNQFMPAGGAAI